MSATPTMTAVPIEDYVWCTDCTEPHDIFDDGTLHLIGEDHESLACQTPTRVEKLPTDWDRTYVAFEVTELVKHRMATVGYDLYETSPKADPATHRPMYYLEET